MIAFIDGDVIAHIACKSRFAKKAEPITGLDEIIMLVEDKAAHKFSKEEDRKYLEDSWNNFNKSLEEILEAVFADDFLMAVKSPSNYRSDIYGGYKMNRHKDPSKMNNFVPTIRKLAVHEGLAVESTGREADDLLRIWATQAEAAGDDYVIVSIDKDLDCIPGKHYHIKHKKLYTVSPLTAMRFYYQQLLSGDPTDNIPGVTKIGPIIAEKLLFNTSTEEEMQEVVVEAYLNAYGDDWYDMLLSNGKLLYLQKSEDDYFTLENWAVAQALKPDPHRARTAPAEPTAPVSVARSVVKSEVAAPKVVPAVSGDTPPWEDAPPAGGGAASVKTAPSPRPSPSPSPRVAPRPVSAPTAEAPPWEDPPVSKPVPPVSTAAVTAPKPSPSPFLKK